MQKIWYGIFWKIISCGCFAGINVLVRFLSGGSPIAIAQPLPIYTIMFFQNLIGTLIIAVYLLRVKTNTKDYTTSQPWLHILRIVTAAIGIGLWYISLRYIPVTQVVAISFIAPIITTVGAVFFLNENFNLQRKLAVACSIFGGFVIARPDQALTNYSNYNWYLLLPLLAAFVFSLDKLLTRKLLVIHETPRTLTWYLIVFMTPLCLLPVVYYGWVTPIVAHLPWLLLLGILGVLAHYTFNRAYALAEVTLLLPFGAAKIILCALLSYGAFLEIPKTFDLWFGILIMTLSTIILNLDLNTLRKIRNFKFNKLAKEAAP